MDFILVASFAVFAILAFLSSKKQRTNVLKEGSTIPYHMIPKLSRVIHCVSSIEGLKYNNGDIIEIKDGRVEEYYICRNYSLYKLDIAQVARLELEYHMNITGVGK